MFLHLLLANRVFFAAIFGGFGGRATLATSGFSDGAVYVLGQSRFRRIWPPEFYGTGRFVGRPIQHWWRRRASAFAADK